MPAIEKRMRGAVSRGPPMRGMKAIDQVDGNDSSREPQYIQNVSMRLLEGAAVYSIQEVFLCGNECAPREDAAARMAECRSSADEK